ncbi:MAG: hypothetical protein M3Y42_07060 [Actinomycetota bacterium]|nr:hypothetical protein [Actinomycetota bacterium]MDQ2956705.1 hypothetical protein [Actinomycetota bacterium]
METTDNPLEVPPGQSVTIVYVGEQIPNQLIMQNVDEFSPVQYSVAGTIGSGNKLEPTWKLVGLLPPKQTISLLVQWPNGIALVTSEDGQGTIQLGGDGIFPYDGGAND